ncbi:hypothetical protein ACLOJK_017507 [Asimina triloba]
MAEEGHKQTNKVKEDERDFADWEELANFVKKKSRPKRSSNATVHSDMYSNDKKSSRKCTEIQSEEESENNRPLGLQQKIPMSRISADGVAKITELSYDEIVEEGDYDPKDSDCLQQGLTVEDEWAGTRLGDSAFYFLKAASEQIGRKKHSFCTSTTILFEFCCDVCHKAKPIDAAFFSSIMHFGNLAPFLSRVLPGCFLRGLKSLIDLDAAAFLFVIWCSIFSIISMAGTFNIFVMLAMIGLLEYVSGAPLAVIALPIYITVFLWLYGNFWATGSIIIIAGINITLLTELDDLPVEDFNQLPPDPLQTTKLLNLSLNADLTWILKSNLKPEEEISRLLRCKDHYAVFGYSRFEKIDVPSLKQKYHKKAILVHPDKHKGDERAVEAFKKLQNAYEVLNNSSKLKSYDDKLKTEEMFSWAQTFQRASLAKRIQTHFSSGSNHSEPVSEDIGGNSRIVACQKCGKFHTWAHRDRLKSRARWCQDCKDFHSAKDGDGWVEQHFHPIIFGLVQKAFGLVFLKIRDMVMNVKYMGNIRVLLDVNLGMRFDEMLKYT